jgi:hypothetical protein
MSHDPARVPLSLIAIICLSVSAAIVPTLGPSPILAEDLRAERLTAHAEGELTAAVDEAGVVAAEASAAAPLVESTTHLASGDPFVVGLRAHAAGALLRRFPIIHQTHNAEVSIRLPSRELPTLVRSIQIEALDGGNAFRLVVDGLREHQVIDGRSHRRSRSHHTRVDLPVLAMHRTATELQHRHTAPVEAPGTTRTVTAAMSGLATARGIGRYRGASITNVVRNDHLALVVNAAALADQQAVLGTVAPSAHRGLRRAALRVGIDELGTVTGTSPVTDRITASLPGPADPAGVRVRTGVSADRALVALTDAASLDRRLTAAHRLELTTVVSLTHNRSPPLPPPSAPSADHLPLGQTVQRSVTLTNVTIEPTGGTTADGHLLARAEGAVRVTTTGIRRWTAGGDRTTTTVQTTHTHRLSARLTVRPAPIPVPERPMPMVSVAQEVGDRALTRWEDTLGSVAEDAVLHGRDRHRMWVTAPVAPGVSRELARVLAADRDRYAAHTRRVDPLTALTQATPPATALAETLPAVRPPVRYAGVGDRAIVAIRMAYRQAVLDDLARRAAQTAEIATTLGEMGLRAPRSIRPDTGRPQRFILRVDPGYLPIRPIDGTHLATVPNTTSAVPLVVRNQNLLGLPHHGLISTLVDRVAPDRTIDPQRAASALAALPRGHPAAPPLRRALADAMRHPSAVSVDLLQPAVGEVRARERVTAVRARLPLTTQPAAFADGRLAAAMTDDPILRARLRVAQRAAMREPDGRIDAALLDPIARGITEAVTDAAADRVTAAIASRLPTGIPISPTLSPWIATVNLWHIEAEGRYLQMTLYDPETGLRYVRAGQPVRVHADGEVHTIGVARRLHIDVETVIAAAVPPGPPGVGDVEGGLDERSPGFEQGPHCLPAHPHCPYGVRNGFATG